MTVEINHIMIYYRRNDMIRGWFRVENYNNLNVDFECKNGVLSFKCGLGIKEQINTFPKWQVNEEKLYTTFLLNYLNEINKINKIVSFKGKLIKESSYEQKNKRYIFNIQYNELPNIVILKFIPKTGECWLFYQVPIPINSKGDYGGVYIHNVLEYETIQRMWEPFRSKTQYRLELLHMLR